MFDIHRVELDWGGRKLVLETGKIARQADGAVLATYGDTTVLATVVAAKQPREGVDFLPLTVDYQEKYYAAGRIPGGYFKREGRPTEKETLVSRLIDRPIRKTITTSWRWSPRRRRSRCRARRSWARSALRASASSATNTSSIRRSTRWPRAISISSSPAPRTRG